MVFIRLTHFQLYQGGHTGFKSTRETCYLEGIFYTDKNSADAHLGSAFLLQRHISPLLPSVNVLDFFPLPFQPTKKKEGKWEAAVSVHCQH